MNTPTVVTERLILRKFTENDINAIYKIFSDAHPALGIQLRRMPENE